METKKYSSYSQIDRELEILKIEKEISYQKLILGVRKTKDSLNPQNIVGRFLDRVKAGLGGYSGKLLNLAIPFITKWIIKKRGC